MATDVESCTETGNGHKVLVDFINGVHSDDVVIAYRDIGYARKLFQNEKNKILLQILGKQWLRVHHCGERYEAFRWNIEWESVATFISLGSSPAEIPEAKA